MHLSIWMNPLNRAFPGPVLLRDRSQEFPPGGESDLSLSVLPRLQQRPSQRRKNLHHREESIREQQQVLLSE